jgi:hypothetical protein
MTRDTISNTHFPEDDNTDTSNQNDLYHFRQ